MLILMLICGLFFGGKKLCWWLSERFGLVIGSILCDSCLGYVWMDRLVILID